MNDNEREVSTPEWAQNIIDSLNSLKDSLTAKPQQEEQPQEETIQEVIVPQPPQPQEEEEQETLIEEMEEEFIRGPEKSDR